MSLGLDEGVLTHAKFLQDLDVDTAEEICKVAFQFLKSGTQLRMIDKAAKRLEWPTEKLQQLLEALMELYRNAARINITKEDLELALTQTVGLSVSHALLLTDFYTSVHADLRDILSHLSFSEANYRNLEWRFEIEIASRTLHNRLRPMFYVQLELEHGAGESKFHTLQMDIPTLLHLTEELEQALQDVKSTQAKRIMRHIK